MVLHPNYVKDNLNKIKEDPHSYMVLKANHLQFTEDTERLELTILLANLRNTICMVNRFFSKSAIKKAIDASMIETLTNAIYTEEPFTDEQLEKFLEFNRNIENIAENIQNLAPDLAEHIYIDSRLEMLLLGFNFEQQRELERKNRLGWVDDDFFNLKHMAIGGEVTPKQYREKSLKLLTDALTSKKKK